MKSGTARSGSTLPRHLVAMFAYVNRQGSGAKCVDGSFGGTEVHLDGLQLPPACNDCRSTGG